MLCHFDDKAQVYSRKAGGDPYLKLDRVLIVCANRSGNIFYKVIASKAKTKQYFEAAKDLLCKPGRAEPTGKAFQRSLG